MRWIGFLTLLGLLAGGCAYKRGLNARLTYEPPALEAPIDTPYPVHVVIPPFRDSTVKYVRTGTRRFVGATMWPLWPLYKYRVSGATYFPKILIEKTIARDLAAYGLFKEIEALTTDTGTAVEHADLVLEGELTELGIHGKITHYGLGFPLVGIPLALVIHGIGLPAEYGVHFKIEMELVLRNRRTGERLWHETVELPADPVVGGFYYGNPAKRLNRTFGAMTTEIAQAMRAQLPSPEDDYWGRLLAWRQDLERPLLVRFRVIYPNAEEETERANIQFKGSLYSPARIEKIEIFCNDRQVEMPETLVKALPAHEINLDACSVELSPGENVVVIAATAAGQTDRKLYRITRTGAGAVAQKPTAIQPRQPTVVGSDKIGHRWAVLIGISEYGRIGAGDLRPLRYAARDAVALAQFFRSPEGGHFQQVHLLVDADATRANILEALNDVEGAQPEDVVVVFFAGHGIADPQRPETGFLLTYESDPSNRGALEASSIPWYQFNQKLRNLRAEKKLVMVDACHAATVLPALRAVGVAEKTNIGRSLTDELRKTLPSTCFIAASGAYENSQEDPRWGDGHGAFTWALLRALRGEADRPPGGDSDGIVRLGEMIRFVKDVVPRETRDQQHPQDSGTYDRNWPLAKTAAPPP